MFAELIINYSNNFFTELHLFLSPAPPSPLTYLNCACAHKINWQQLLPLAALLAKLTFGGLWSRNCLKEEHILWKNFFLDYMSFRMTCLMRAYIWREVMLGRRKYLMGSIVLVECMSSGWHIFQYVVFYWKTCHTGAHVLLEGM